MPYRDPIKAHACKLRYRAKKHAERFGHGAGDMRGRHGNHARGEKNRRWNGGIMHTGQGYIAIAVPAGHHLRQAHGYGYEHDLVAEKMIGRALFPGEIVHHRNGIRSDNRAENLVVETIAEHARGHVSAPGARDSRGRFAPGINRTIIPAGADPLEWPEDLRGRELPEATHDDP